MGSVIELLPGDPSSNDVSNAIERIVTLFRAIESPPARSSQGLWGELFLIANARDPVAMVEAWHAQTSEHYDFAASCQRIDVKTSSDRTRIHYVSYAQVYPPRGTQAVIVSMFVERLAGGLKLGELWETAKLSVGDNADLRLKIDEICFASLGNSWEGARSLAFDERLCAASVVLFDVRDIPRVAEQVPIGVSDIRFRTSLESAVPLHLSNRPVCPLAALLTNIASNVERHP